MRRLHAKHLTLVLAALAAIVLAATVFLWGVQYKCSLYPVPAGKHTRVAVAKLLSERERPVAWEAGATRAPLNGALFFALGLLLLAGDCAPRTEDGGRLSRSAGAADDHRTCCVNYFSFRPPPVCLA